MRPKPLQSRLQHRRFAYLAPQFFRGAGGVSLAPQTFGTAQIGSGSIPTSSSCALGNRHTLSLRRRPCLEPPLSQCIGFCLPRCRFPFPSLVTCRCTSDVTQSRRFTTTRASRPLCSPSIMFCLRSWLPLLFIPTNASPAFIFLFFICTYFLNRPCVYCSILLLILFLTSCNWSDRCFFDFSSNWFLPRPIPSHPTDVIPDSAGLFNASVVEMMNTTATALTNAALEAVAERKHEWSGLGIEWLRSLLGKREWRIDCMDIYVRL